MKKLLLALFTTALLSLFITPTIAGTFKFKLKFTNTTNAQVKILPSGIAPDQSTINISPNEDNATLEITADDKKGVVGSMTAQFTDDEGVFGVLIKFSTTKNPNKDLIITIIATPETPKKYSICKPQHNVDKNKIDPVFLTLQKGVECRTN